MLRGSSQRISGALVGIGYRISIARSVYGLFLSSVQSRGRVLRGSLARTWTLHTTLRQFLVSDGRKSTQVTLVFTPKSPRITPKT